MDVGPYLNRINYSCALSPTNAVLQDLHHHHVQEVPFENLDVYYKRTFGLQLQSIYDKVVINKRGGFCYELNLLFHWLLNEIGFDSKIIEARIFDEAGALGPPFDHMSIYVKTDRPFLLDVGYGDLFVTPLEIRSGVQHDGRNYFTIDKVDNSTYLLRMSTDGITYHKKYTFTIEEVSVRNFYPACLDKQINPTSYFVRNIVCTKPTKTGRVTIFNQKLIERIGETKTEIHICDDADLRLHLNDKFDIVIHDS